MDICYETKGTNVLWRALRMNFPLGWVIFEVSYIVPSCPERWLLVKPLPNYSCNNFRPESQKN
jgi:hypothetical protein